MNNNYCDIQDNCEIVNQFKAELSKEKNKHNILKKMFADIDSINVGLHKKLDQLKAELEQEKALKETYLACYKAKHEDIKGALFKLKQALQEIKEIIQEEIECKIYEVEHDCFNETRCKAINEHIEFLKHILQKISECEV